MQAYADANAVFRHEPMLRADTITEINSAIHLQFRQAHEGHKVRASLLDLGEMIYADRSSPMPGSTHHEPRLV